MKPSIYNRTKKEKERSAARGHAPINMARLETEPLKITKAGALALCLFVSICNFIGAQPRTIGFAGQEWFVKQYDSLVGPGPNYFSDHGQNVWVDENGWLHLKIHYDSLNQRWWCAEVIAKAPTRFGAHHIQVSGFTDQLDPNVVLGVFLYKHMGHGHKPEIDIEFSRWGNANNPTNASFSLHAHNQRQFHQAFYYQTNKKGELTCHLRWTRRNIHYAISHGHNQRASLFKTRHFGKYRLGPGYHKSLVPHESDGLCMHLNLWLVNGQPPMNGKSAEIVVKNVLFPAQKAK
jgi:hypothetical protein